jgi:hypothetical protein
VCADRPDKILTVPGLALIALTCSAALLFAKPNGGPVKRARPPQQWPQEVQDVFFEDAHEKLVGPRPDYSRAAKLASRADDEAGVSPDSQTAANAAAWSKLIDAETIETEIKRLAKTVASDVATPSQFKGGAYKQCRRNFSLLAVLFAVAAEYDGAVRWSDVAPALRDQFARAGYNCKVGTDQTYSEAQQRSQDLAELIRGGRPQLTAAEQAADWAHVADRPPLMQRLEIAHQDRLTKWLANERQFTQHRDDVRHEAQLVATLADVIGRKGFEYWDDEEYAQYADELRQAATDIAAAAERENYEQAQQAVSRATGACTNCHEGYRG